MAIIHQALCICGLEPEAEVLMPFNIFCKHWNELLLYQFPDHYSDFLRLLMQSMTFLFFDRDKLVFWNWLGLCCIFSSPQTNSYFILLYLQISDFRVTIIHFCDCICIRHYAVWYQISVQFYYLLNQMYLYAD